MEDTLRPAGRRKLKLKEKLINMNEEPEPIEPIDWPPKVLDGRMKVIIHKVEQIEGSNDLAFQARYVDAEKFEKWKGMEKK